MNRILLLMSGLGLGAGLMHIMDPDRGGRRRTRAQRHLAQYRRRTDDSFGRLTHTLGRQVRHFLPRPRLSLRYQPPGPGERLLARVEQLEVTRSLVMLGSAALGAGIMYMLDPDRGKRRRALLRDKSRAYWQRTGQSLSRTTRDLRHRTRGLLMDVSRQMRRPDGSSDTVLIARVRSQLGHVLSNVSAMEIVAHQGRVVLSGPVAAHEVDQLLATVKGVAGVTEVVNQLTVHNAGEHLSEKQNANSGS